VAQTAARAVYPFAAGHPPACKRAAVVQHEPLEMIGMARAFQKNQIAGSEIATQERTDFAQCFEGKEAIVFPGRSRFERAMGQWTYKDHLVGSFECLARHRRISSGSFSGVIGNRSDDHYFAACAGCSDEPQ